MKRERKVRALTPKEELREALRVVTAIVNQWTRTIMERDQYRDLYESGIRPVKRGKRRG